MRKGFSYKQIMQGRWDIDIKFDELLMPEFIGGISRELSMRTVEQTVDQQGSTSQGQYAEALGSKTGTLGDYLGLPTFGTRISSTVTLTDTPCSPNARNVTDTPLETVMNQLRDDQPVSGSSCTDHLNTNGTQTVLFYSLSSSTVIPTNVSQIGIDVTLTGGKSEVFDGTRGILS